MNGQGSFNNFGGAFPCSLQTAVISSLQVSQGSLQYSTPARLRAPRVGLRFASLLSLFRNTFQLCHHCLHLTSWRSPAEKKNQMKACLAWASCALGASSCTARTGNSRSFCAAATRRQTFNRKAPGTDLDMDQNFVPHVGTAVGQPSRKKLVGSESLL